MKDYSGLYIRRSMPQPYVHHISHLLDHYTFTLPSYQRNYQWGPREATLLLHDIMNLVHGGEPLHYFGEAVYYHKPYSYGPMTYVVDSQQRTITALILLTAIREQTVYLLDHYKTIHTNGADFISTINKLIINRKSSHNHGLTFQITYADTTGQKEFKRALDALFLHGSTDFPKTNDSAVKHLASVYSTLIHAFKHITNLQHSAKKALNKLEQIYYAFVDGFYLSDIQTDDAVQALTIYITLNTRNKPLGLADIIKAELSAIIRRDESLSQADRDKLGSKDMKKWNDIVSTLNNNNDAVIGFVQDYWYASRTDVVTRDLPRDISREFKTAKDVTDFVNDLYNMRYIYRALFFPRTTHMVRWIAPIRPFLILASDLKHTYANDLILAMYHNHYSSHDLLRVAKAIKRLMMRRIFTNREHYSFVAKYAWHHDKDVQGILTHILRTSNGLQEISNNAVYDNCLNYRHTLTKSSTKPNNLIRYVLVNYYHATSNGVDFPTPLNTFQTVFRDRQIDYNKYTPVVIGNDNMKDWHDSIGNVALLETSLVAQMSSNGLSSKAIAFGKSRLKANTRLGEQLTHIKNGNHRDTNLSSLIIDRNQKIARNYEKTWR